MGSPRSSTRSTVLLSNEVPANAYENQSGGVIEMLEKLNDEFSSKKRELEKDELGAQQGYEQIAHLTNNLHDAALSFVYIVLNMSRSVAAMRNEIR